MVKAYLPYQQSACFGVLSSGSASCVSVNEDGAVATPALESINVWNSSAGTLLRTLKPEPSGDGESIAGETTSLVSSESAGLIASGARDGAVRIWNNDSNTIRTAMRGHTKAVTALNLDKTPSRLASGGQDTDIVVWDILAERGMFRLKGHRNQITDVEFMERGDRLISSSKDTHVRVWDLNVQMCVQVIASIHEEAWGVALSPKNETRLLVATRGGIIKTFRALEEVGEEGGADRERSTTEEDEVFVYQGDILRQTGGSNASFVQFDKRGGLLAFQGDERSVEVFRTRTSKEAEKHRRRREKRRRKEGNGNEGEERQVERSAADEFVHTRTLKTKGRVKGVTFITDTKEQKSKKRDANGTQIGSNGSTQFKIAVALASNSMEIHSSANDGGTARNITIQQSGHRHDIRSVCLSSDDEKLLTTSHQGAKVWNPQTGQCLRTLECGYGLSSFFAPGDRYAVVACKGGEINILDAQAGSLVDGIDAHSAAVWSISQFADKSGFVSGAADKTCKFWKWEIEQEEGGHKRLGMRLERTYEASEDVLSVRVSSEGRVVAVSLLDASVRVLYLDSLKTFLTLYGHKLPVISMSASRDSTLLATGSADKNIRLWGLDFGDCHASMYAHGDSVMDVSFIKDTHYLMSAGKDGKVKYWDMDRREELMSLSGHKAEVWTLAISSEGDFVVSGGHDKSIRIWQRTDEAFALEEEKERRMDDIFEEGLGRAEVAGGETLPATRTRMTVTQADRIADALSVAEEEEKRLWGKESGNESKGTEKGEKKNPVMREESPSEYVLKEMKKVRQADLEQALLILPVESVLGALKYVQGWLEARREVEMASRVAILLVKLHFQRLQASSQAKPLLVSLQRLLAPRLDEMRHSTGLSLSSLQKLRSHISGQCQDKATFS